MDIPLILAMVIFSFAFIAMIFDASDKSIIAMAGGLLMIITGILDFNTAVEGIDFETIGLLMGMMILVDLASSSGAFEWLNVQLTKRTRGKPWLIYSLFLFVTALFSAFLDNVTTVLIIIPIVTSLTKGMGLNSKFFIVSLILFSNIGGALTLIGGPPNIIIGSAAHLSFNDFIINLSIPISAVAILSSFILVVFNWSSLKPLSGNLKQLFLTHLLIKKIEQQFVKVQLKPRFVIKVLSLILLVILGFTLEPILHLNLSVIALTGAVLLLISTSKNSCVHKTFSQIEWSTLFFFIGLFVMVTGLEHVGFLEKLSNFLLYLSDGRSYIFMLLLVLWMCGLVSMILDNIPFVTIMVPVIFQIQESLAPGLDPQLLWWALSLGACLGGCGTPIGASANIVSLSIARREGINISFIEYLKISLPLTLMALSICSVYFYYLAG